MRTISKPNEFGLRLKGLRAERCISVRELARKAEMSAVLLTLLENGHRGVSIDTLIRLGNTCDLKDIELLSFLLEGMDASRRDKLLPEVRGFSAKINNALALELRAAGVGPEEISGVDLYPVVSKAVLLAMAKSLKQRAEKYEQRAGLMERHHRANGPQLGLRLRDGTQIYPEIMLAKD